jgi:hypothetical protein
MIYQQLLDDLEEVSHNPHIILHHIPIMDFQGIPLTDLSRSREMIEKGYLVTREYLQNPPTGPLIPPPAFTAPPPPGARVWQRVSRRVK